MTFPQTDIPNVCMNMHIFVCQDLFRKCIIFYIFKKKISLSLSLSFSLIINHLLSLLHRYESFFDFAFFRSGSLQSGYSVVCCSSRMAEISTGQATTELFSMETVILSPCSCKTTSQWTFYLYFLGFFKFKQKILPSAT